MVFRQILQVTLPSAAGVEKLLEVQADEDKLESGTYGGQISIAI